MIEKPLDDIHLYAKRHTDFVLPFDITDDDGVKAAMAGCFVAMQGRTAVDAPSTVFSITSAPAGGITLDALVETPTGDYTVSVLVVLPHALLATIAQGDVFYDIVLTDSAGLRHYLFGGKFNLSGTVTKIGAP